MLELETHSIKKKINVSILVQQITIENEKIEDNGEYSKCIRT